MRSSKPNKTQKENDDEVQSHPQEDMESTGEDEDDMETKTDFDVGILPYKVEKPDDLSPPPQRVSVVQVSKKANLELFLSRSSHHSHQSNATRYSTKCIHPASLTFPKDSLSVQRNQLLVRFDVSVECKSDSIYCGIESDEESFSLANAFDSDDEFCFWEPDLDSSAGKLDAYLDSNRSSTLATAIDDILEIIDISVTTKRDLDPKISKTKQSSRSSTRGAQKQSFDSLSNSWHPPSQYILSKSSNYNQKKQPKSPPICSKSFNCKQQEQSFDSLSNSWHSPSQFILSKSSNYNRQKQPRSTPIHSKSSNYKHQEQSSDPLSKSWHSSPSQFIPSKSSNYNQQKESFDSLSKSWHSPPQSIRSKSTNCNRQKQSSDSLSKSWHSSNRTKQSDDLPLSCSLHSEPWAPRAPKRNVRKKMYISQKQLANYNASNISEDLFAAGQNETQAKKIRSPWNCDKDLRWTATPATDSDSENKDVERNIDCPHKPSRRGSLLQ